MKTFGRQTIYANYTEEQLLSATEEQQENIILDILNNSIAIHDKNFSDSIYLINYLYGDQDIKDKVKKTRTDINNTGVENWAWAFMDWKKAFLVGKPIQYAPLDDVANEEISTLNKYNVFEDKDQKDQELYEDIFAVGRAFRYVNYSKVSEEDEAPYDLINLDVLNTEVVYSSSIKHEQLLTYVKTSKQHITQEIDPETKEPKQVIRYYDEYTVYTRNKKIVVNNMSGDLAVVEQTIKGKNVRFAPIIQNVHLVTEYYFNKHRMSLLEICKDIFDDINYVENLDKDDIEQFVNAIMVFTNAEIDKERLNAIKEYGAVSIKSTDQKKASVELLQSRLKSLDTQIYYLRKLSALHAILSVPEASQSGYISNAETGKAVLTGQGFTSASVRIETEEKSFKKCDRNALKVILKVCRNASDSNIKNLKVSDIDIKFSRDLSDNLLVKTQALLSLTEAQIPPEIRNAVINLFSDPVAVTKMQEQYIEEQRTIQEELKSRGVGNKIKEQNNEIEDIVEIDNQQQ